MHVLDKENVVTVAPREQELDSENEVKAKAMDLAKKEFRVFPVIPDKKSPLIKDNLVP